MVGIDSTVWDIDPHTQAKHQILEEYLKKWFPILGSTAEQVVYLDGFAGPGIYSNDEEGSPVIAIRTALQHTHSRRFKKLTFWFIEEKPERARTLEQVLKSKFSELPQNFQYKIKQSEFAPSLETALDRIEEEGAKLAPTFAFIDPFGFSGIPMNLITRVLGYKRCEVLITFMSSFIIRFNDERRENALDDLFGTKNWRTLRNISNPDEKRRFIVDFYVKQLHERGDARYYRTFEMVGDNKQIVYHLVFATKHLAGLKAMKEAMFKVDRRGTFRFSDRTDPGQTFLVDYSDDKSWLPQASGSIFNEFAGKSVTVEKVEEFVWEKTSFVFRKSILQRLEKEGKIANVVKRIRKNTFPSGCIIEFHGKGLFF